MNSRRMLRGLIISALLSALVYAVLAAVGDVRSVAASLTSFPLATLGAIVALTLACYTVRSLRWRYLVRATGHELSVADAAFIQYSGMTMAVTPGKVGEVLKAFLARELSGLAMGPGVALVFCERLADVVAVTALSAGAIGAVTNSGPALAIAAAALVAGVAMLGSRRFHDLVLAVALRQRWIRDHQESAEAVSATVREMLRLRPLATSVLMSATAWSCEGIAFALCIRTLGFGGLSVPAAVGVYAISTLVGAFTFLPGGIGLTEASLAGLLVSAGMARGDASAATLIIRLVTLWFGVVLGWAVLATRPALLKTLTRSAD